MMTYSSQSSVADDNASDAEKDGLQAARKDHAYSTTDLEKQDQDQRRRQEDGFTNLEPVPGVPVDEEEFADPDQSNRRDVVVAPAAGQQGGLSIILSRALSRTSIKSVPGPPPDGGLEAWTMAACSHLVVLNTWGFINSYGVFQTYYASVLSRPPSDIAWIGSVQVFLLFFIGAFTGRLTDAGYFRHIFLLGSAFQVIGIFTAAQATQYWQLFLSHGVCIGLGNGCLFCPCVAILSTYFSKHRNIAIGIAACGSATGGLVFPSMARQLLPSVGFPWAMRAIGFVQVAVLVVANAFLKPRIPPRRTGALVEWTAFRELEYTFYAAGAFFCFLGVYFAFYYLAAFTRDILELPLQQSLNLLLVLNGAGVVGRLAPNHVADQVGPLTVFVPVAFGAAACTFAWPAVHDQAGLYVWAVFYGIVAGGIQSLFPAGLSSLTTDLRKAGVRLGMVFTIVSFATLAGPPVEGAIIHAMGGSYLGAQLFAGLVLLIGTGFLGAARMVKARRLGEGWKAKV